MYESTVQQNNWINLFSNQLKYYLFFLVKVYVWYINMDIYKLAKVNDYSHYIKFYIISQDRR